MNITEMLDAISEHEAAIEAVRLAYTEKRKEIIPPEIQEQIDDLEAELLDVTRAARVKISNLSDEVKAEVLATGATVKGAHLQAVYSKGRVSWDTSKLDVYAKAYPEIAELRKEGEPSVSIRAIK